jgi:hypothetical protein
MKVCVGCNLGQGEVFHEEFFEDILRENFACDVCLRHFRDDNRVENVSTLQGYGDQG